MVNGKWCLSVAQVERLPLDSDTAQLLFTIYHSPFTSSEFVLVVEVVFVVQVFLGDVQLDGVESDDLQLRPALVARDGVAFVGVKVNVDFGFAVRARSYRHSSFLQVSC